MKKLINLLMASIIMISSFGAVCAYEDVPYRIPIKTALKYKERIALYTKDGVHLSTEDFHHEYENIECWGKISSTYTTETRKFTWAQGDYQIITYYYYTNTCTD